MFSIMCSQEKGVDIIALVALIVSGLVFFLTLGSFIYQYFWRGKLLFFKPNVYFIERLKMGKSYVMLCFPVHIRNTGAYTRSVNFLKIRMTYHDKSWSHDFIMHTELESLPPPQKSPSSATVFSIPPRSALTKIIGFRSNNEDVDIPHGVHSIELLFYDDKGIESKVLEFSLNFSTDIACTIMQGAPYIDWNYSNSSKSIKSHNSGGVDRNPPAGRSNNTHEKENPMQDAILSLENLLYELILYPFRFLRTLFVFIVPSWANQYFEIQNHFLEFRNKDSYFRSVREANFVTPYSFCILITAFIVSALYYSLRIIGSTFSILDPSSLQHSSPIASLFPSSLTNLFVLKEGVVGFVLSFLIAIVIMTCILSITYRLKMRFLGIFQTTTYIRTPKTLRTSFFSQFSAFFSFLCFSSPVMVFLLSAFVIIVSIYPNNKDIKSHYSSLITLVIIADILYLTITNKFTNNIFVMRNGLRMSAKLKMVKCIYFLLKTTLKFCLFFICFIMITNIVRATTQIDDVVQLENATDYMEMKSASAIDYSAFLSDNQKEEDVKTVNYCKVCDFKELSENDSDFKFGHLESLRTSENATMKNTYNKIMGTVYLCRAYETIFCPPISGIDNIHKLDYEDLLSDIFAMWDAKAIYCDMNNNSIIEKTRILSTQINEWSGLNAPKYMLEQSEKYFTDSNVEKANAQSEIQCLYAYESAGADSSSFKGNVSLSPKISVKVANVTRKDKTYESTVTAKRGDVIEYLVRVENNSEEEYKALASRIEIPDCCTYLMGHTWIYYRDEKNIDRKVSLQDFIIDKRGVMIGTIPEHHFENIQYRVKVKADAKQGTYGTGNQIFNGTGINVSSNEGRIIIND